MEHVKNFIKFCTFITLTFFLIIKTGDVFVVESVNKGSEQGQTYTTVGFYELPKNSIDVLFVGDSTLLNGISPMELWKKAGIVSYNNSVTSIRTYATYYLLQEALKTQTPKVVVIDPDTMFYKYNFYEPLQRAHINYFKNNYIKFQMINDPNYDLTFEDKVSAFFPLLRYHSRWKELKTKDFAKLTKDYTSYTKGLVMTSSVKPSTTGETYMNKSNDKIKFENNSYEYLEKIYNLCKEKNIELFILEIPDSKDWGISQSNKIKEYAESRGIKCLDLNTIDIGINWNEDSKDGGAHMNVLGALKVSEYLADYMVENFDLEDHRDDPKYAYWHEDYKVYEKMLKEYITATQKNIKKNEANVKNTSKDKS